MGWVRGIALALFSLASFQALPANAAVVISAANGASPYNSPATFDFNAPTPQWSGSIFTDSLAGYRATPLGSGGGYAAVGPATESGGNDQFLDLTGFAGIGEISLLWGSVDTYNYLDVMSGSSVLYTFSGSDVANPANGDQSSPGQNRIVTLAFTGSDKFDTTALRFRSGDAAFEFDNLRVSAVPEPAGWALLLLGFGLVGMGIRSRRRSVVLA